MNDSFLLYFFAALSFVLVLFNIYTSWNFKRIAKLEIEKLYRNLAQKHLRIQRISNEELTARLNDVMENVLPEVIKNPSYNAEPTQKFMDEVSLILKENQDILFQYIVDCVETDEPLNLKFLLKTVAVTNSRVSKSNFKLLLSSFNNDLNAELKMANLYLFLKKYPDNLPVPNEFKILLDDKDLNLRFMAFNFYIRFAKTNPEMNEKLKEFEDFEGEFFKHNFSEFSHFLFKYEKFGNSSLMYSEQEDKTLLNWFERKQER